MNGGLIVNSSKTFSTRISPTLDRKIHLLISIKTNAGCRDKRIRLEDWGGDRATYLTSLIAHNYDIFYIDWADTNLSIERVPS